METGWLGRFCSRWLRMGYICSSMDILKGRERGDDDDNDDAMKREKSALYARCRHGIFGYELPFGPAHHLSSASQRGAALRRDFATQLQGGVCQSTSYSTYQSNTSSLQQHPHPAFLSFTHQRGKSVLGGRCWYTCSRLSSCSKPASCSC
jgi:hypothetical protein